MSRAAQTHQPDTVAHIGPIGLLFAAIFWILMGFSDGPVYMVMDRIRLDGHLLFIVPLVILYFSYFAIFKRIHISRQALIRQAGIAILFVVCGMIQAAFLGSFRSQGLIQLYAMLAIMVLFRDMFAENPETMGRDFGRIMMWVHIVVCGYCILSWIALNQFQVSIDFDFGRVTGLRSYSRSIFKRAAGLQREPAWAGLAMSVSFAAAYLLNHKNRILTVVLFGLGIIACGSATAVLFAGAFCIYTIFRQKGLGLSAKLLFVIVPSLIFSIFFQDRVARMLAGRDPSTLMRLRSFDIGWRVIQNTFPVGTGYGNFRNAARYGGLWSNYIDLSRVTFYKTDVMWVNIVSELGLVGILVLLIFFWIFYSTNRPILVLLGVVFMLAAGSLIMPYLFALSAVCGLMTAERRLSERRQREWRPQQGLAPPLAAPSS